MTTKKRKTKPIESRFPDVCHDVRLNLASFHAKVQKPEHTDCWLWTGGRHRQGFGMCGAWRIADQKSIMITAHRASWRIYRGPITEPNIIHLCTTPNCVNPDHLATGTQREVVRTQIARGRRHYATGPRGTYQDRPWRPGMPKGAYPKRTNWRYKHTDEDIQFMRVNTIQAIADHFGISTTLAGRRRYYARYGYRWLPLPDNFNHALISKNIDSDSKE